MTKITTAEKPKVTEFLQRTFQLPQTLATEYAEIAILLSDDARMLDALARVSDALSVIRLQLEERLPDDQRHGLRGKENLLGKSILLLCKTLGWTIEDNYQLQGNVQADAFNSLVRGGHMWRDHVSANHGDYSHCLQWLAIYCVMPSRALELYKKSVDYSSGETRFNRYVCGVPRPMSDVSLWVFLVDCFPATHEDDDWRQWIKTTTCRSPSKLRQLVMGSQCDEAAWLSAKMREHQDALGWRAGKGVTPVSGAQATKRDFHSVQQFEAVEKIKRGAILRKVDPSLQYRLEFFFNLQPEQP